MRLVPAPAEEDLQIRTGARAPRARDRQTRPAGVSCVPELEQRRERHARVNAQGVIARLRLRPRWHATTLSAAAGSAVRQPRAPDSGASMCSSGLRSCAPRRRHSARATSTVRDCVAAIGRIRVLQHRRQELPPASARSSAWLTRLPELRQHRPPELREAVTAAATATCGALQVRDAWRQLVRPRQHRLCLGSARCRRQRIGGRVPLLR